MSCFDIDALPNYSTYKRERCCQGRFWVNVVILFCEAITFHRNQVDLDLTIILKVGFAHGQA